MSDRNDTKRRRTADETRALILDAAIEWIEQHGTAGLKVVDISRSSGVSEVLIYRYFNDRSGLLTAALLELWDRYMTEPVAEARAALEALPDEAFTIDFLVSLNVLPSDEVHRRRRWARLQVLAASPELPELVPMIRKTQSRLNREHESLVDYIRTRMPGRHFPSARIMRMLNQGIAFGLVLDELSDDPITDQEFGEFLHEFFTRAYEPGVSEAP